MSKRRKGEVEDDSRMSSRGAVKLVKQSDWTMSAIAMEPGISSELVGEWVRNPAESGNSISEDERAEWKRYGKKISELSLPALERLRGDPHLPNDLFDLRARLSLAKGEGDLLLREFRFLHGELSSSRVDSAKSQHSEWISFFGAGQPNSNRYFRRTRFKGPPDRRDGRVHVIRSPRPASRRSRRPTGRGSAARTH